MATAVWRLMDRHPTQAQTYDPRQDPELRTLIEEEYYGDPEEVALQILQMVSAWQLDHTNNSTNAWTYATAVVGTVGITDGPAGFCSPDRGGGGGAGIGPIKPLKSTYRYGKLDEYGRATEAEAVLVAPITKGSKSRAAVPGLDTNYHDRTHLIPKELGGSGRRENIVPMYWNVNQQVMVEFEQQVAAAVNRGDVVRYKVTPQYHGSESVPFAVTIEAKGSTIDLQVSVLNRPDPVNPRRLK
jgi:DNA/RNA non-specific endonuclease